MKHDFYLDETGEIDYWRMSSNYHNGPECKRCHEVWCEHCHPECYEEECPSGQ
jgi:hypothetical protein